MALHKYTMRKKLSLIGHGSFIGEYVQNLEAKLRPPRCHTALNEFIKCEIERTPLLRSMLDRLNVPGRTIDVTSPSCSFLLTECFGHLS